jgi:uncharacterized membrane protein YphA (DoxX/SURF4 family)
MEMTTMRSNTLRTATYWISTGLVGLDFLVGGAFQIARSPEAVQGFAHLGYPTYFVILVGIWKLLGAIALLVPGFPRLKEWAYAGIFFDLTGAVVSIVAVGDGWGPAMLPLAFLVLAVASWALRPSSRTLATPAKRGSDASALSSSVSAAA